MNPHLNIILMFNNCVKLNSLVRFTQLDGSEQMKIDAIGSNRGN